MVIIHKIDIFALQLHTCTTQLQALNCIFIWPKYCRYGVKLLRYIINHQSYNEHVIQTLFTGELITGVSAAGVGCVFFSIPNCKNIFSTCTDRWTDRQTDRQTDGKTQTTNRQTGKTSNVTY